MTTENEEKAMGRFSVEVELANDADIMQAEIGVLALEMVRRMRIRGVVDSGATRLVIPETVAQQLGLQLAGSVKVTYADGRSAERSVVRRVQLTYGGRDSIFNAIVEPGSQRSLGRSCWRTWISSSIASVSALCRAIRIRLFRKLSKRGIAQNAGAEGAGNVHFGLIQAITVPLTADRRFGFPQGEFPPISRPSNRPNPRPCVYGGCELGAANHEPRHPPGRRQTHVACSPVGPCRLSHMKYGQPCLSSMNSLPAIATAVSHEYSLSRCRIVIEPPLVGKPAI